jgi:Na+-driven multidrug efflux pump
MSLYFVRLEHYVSVDLRQWVPRLASWRRILGIGAPAGGEFVMMFVIFSFIYWVIRPFGAPAQAGFGVGTRVMQAIFLPAMAVAFSVAPIVGQNFGAHRFERVRATVWSAAWMSALLMLLAMLVVQWRAPALIRAFTADPAAACGRRLPGSSSPGISLQRLFSPARRAAGPGQHLAFTVGSLSRVATFIAPVL